MARPLNLAVWVKSNAGQGSFYRSQHELVGIFRVGEEPHLNNVELGRHGRSRSNVWHYAGVNTFRAGRLDELKSHPTVKPVALVADAMKDCTRRGDIVLDTFCGSGTTILAAERVGRRAYTLELEPRFVDVAIKRWQAFTRRDAIHAAAGLTFDDIASQRTAPPAATLRRRLCAEGGTYDQVSPKARSDGDNHSSSAQPAYAVGYGRPPEHTRFKPGQSGNRRGRPRRQRNVRTVVEETLNQRIKIREGNATRSLTKLDGMILTMINGALEGRAEGAGRIHLAGAVTWHDGRSPGSNRLEPLTDNDDALLADYLERRGDRFDAP